MSRKATEHWCLTPPESKVTRRTRPQVQAKQPSRHECWTREELEPEKRDTVKENPGGEHWNPEADEDEGEDKKTIRSLKERIIELEYQAKRQAEEQHEERIAAAKHVAFLDTGIIQDETLLGHW